MKESSCNIQIPVSHRTSYFWFPFPISKKIVFANISRFYQLCFNFRAQGYKVQRIHLWINCKSVKKIIKIVLVHQKNEKLLQIEKKL